MNILLTVIPFGFSIWTFIWAFKKSNRYIIHYDFDKIDRVAVNVTIIIGIIYIFKVLTDFTNNDEKMIGKYAWGFWFYSSVYLLPVLLRFSNFRQSKVIRLLIAIFVIFTLYFETFVIVITSFKGDYIEIRNNIIIEVILGVFIRLAIFILVIGLILKIKEIIKVR